MNKMLIISFLVLGILSYSSEFQIITCCENCYRKNSKIKVLLPEEFIRMFQ